MSLTANEANSNAAYVEGTEFGTLSAAISHAANGATVKLLTDVTEDETIEAGKTITLDLNGHKLTNASGHTITNNGTLTITDSSDGKTGTIDNLTHGKTPVENMQGATCTIEKAIITRSKEAGASKEDSGGNSYYYIENFGTMTIGAKGADASSVTVGSDGHFSSLVHNGWYDGTKNTSGDHATMTINAGNFKGGINTIKNDDYGTTTINGGTFQNATQYALQNWNEATINGGSFESTERAAVFTGASNQTMDKGITNVYGGEFKSVGNSDFRLYNDGANPTVNVYGGTFSKDPSSVVATGYAAAINADDNYIVGKDVAKAKVGGKAYTTLQLAINAAADDDNTVSLVADIDENVTVSKTLTLDLKGHTLNGKQVKGTPTISITGGDVTIEDTSEAQTGTVKREDTEANTGVSSHYVIDIQQDANVTIKGGKFTNGSGKLEKNTDGSVAKRQGASVIRVGNDDYTQYSPILTIEGGSFEQDNFVVLKNDCGTLTFNGGTVKCANDEAVKNYKDTSINGGNIEGVVSSWAYSGSKFDSELVINAGAKIASDVYAMNYNGAATKNAKVSIKGGSISGSLGIYKGTCIQNKEDLADSDLMSIEVTGGTFDNDPTAYVESGYNAVTGSDGKYVVIAQAYEETSTDGNAAGSATTDGNVDVDNSKALADEAVNAAKGVAGVTVPETGKTTTVGDTTVKVATDQQKTDLENVKKAATETGAKVDVKLLVKADTSATVDNAIAGSVKDSAAEFIPFDLSVDMVTTVSLNNEPKASASVPVVETTNPVKVTIAVDKDSIANKRISVARNHDGVVDILDASVDYDYGSVSFETDKFSSYAIVATSPNTYYRLTTGRDTVVNSEFGYPNSYAFAGWFQDPQLTTPCEKGTAYDTAYPKFVEVSDLIAFKGGSLRMDLTGENDYSKTSLRFGYDMKVPAGATLDVNASTETVTPENVKWGWVYTSSVSENAKGVAVKNYWLTGDNGAIANLVLTPINASGSSIDYKTEFQVKAQVAYTTADGTYVTAADSARTRSVKSVAEEIGKNTFASSAEKAYAEGILKTIDNK